MLAERAEAAERASEQLAEELETQEAAFQEEALRAAAAGRGLVAVEETEVALQRHAAQERGCSVRRRPCKMF